MDAFFWNERFQAGFKIGLHIFTAVVITIALVSCGQLPTAGVGAATQTASATDTKTQTAPAVEQDAPAGSSFYLKTKADLWPCTDKIDKQLIYVADEAVFYTCQKNDWTEVEIKGKDGEKGAQGDKGDTGVAGAAGVNSSAVATAAKDGKDGKDGKNGKDAPYVGPDEWIDPATGSKWYLGMSISRIDVRDFDTLCNAPGVMPNEKDLMEARKNGLMDQLRKNLKNNEYFWVGLDSATYGYQVGQVIIVTANASAGGAVEGRVNPVNYNADSNASKTFHRTLCVIK